MIKGISHKGISHTIMMLKTCYDIMPNVLCCSKQHHFLKKKSGHCLGCNTKHIIILASNFLGHAQNLAYGINLVYRHQSCNYNESIWS